MRKVACACMFILAACATVTVSRLHKADFKTYDIPARVAVIGIDESLPTRAKAGELIAGLRDAGFDVAAQAYVAGALGAYSIALKDVINTKQYAPLRDIVKLDGIVLVREFYGTELHIIRLADGKEIASDCWRTDYVTIINDAIDQMKNKKTGSLLCPVKMK